jgi:RND family efflux transporter MFP subunit
MQTKFYFHLTIITLVILAFANACSSSSDESSEASEMNSNAIVPAVEAVQAEVGRLPNEERLTGLVRAKNQVEIFPEISAPIEKVFVQNGTFVDAGTMLIKLKEQQLRELYNQAVAGADVATARARQADAALKQVDSQFNRVKTLADKGLSSDLDLEAAQANLASAKANYELAQAQVSQAIAVIDQRKRQLEQTEIIAPVSGLVGLRNAEVGMQVNPNMRLFVMGDPSNTIVEVTLNEAMLDYIQIAQTVRILSDRSEDFYLTAKVSRISPFLDPVSHSTTAEIDISNASAMLMPGMFVQVDVLYGDSDQATLVPISALFNHPITGEQGVYVAINLGLETQPAEQVSADDIPPLSAPTAVEFKSVEILAKGRMKAGVSNLKPGDWVITIGQDRLTGGINEAKVRAVSWSRVITMQELQQEDILEEFIEGQKEQIRKANDKQSSAKAKTAKIQGEASSEKP